MTSKARNKRRNAKRKATVSPEERVKRAVVRKHRASIRSLFANAGFQHVPTREIEIQFDGRKSDLDSLFVFENVLVIVEDTAAAMAHVSEHLRKKAEFYKHCQSNLPAFVDTLSATFPRLKEYRAQHADYSSGEFHVRFLYCSRYGVDDNYRDRYKAECQFVEHAHLQYFVSLARAIRRSARFELFKYLQLQLDDIGSPTSGAGVTRYQGLLLPEAPSGYPPGHRLVSFLVDPATLLERAYVFRSDSWRDHDALYQRLLVKGKITNMRDYLVAEKRVFTNNIIVTLPFDTALPPSNKLGPSDVRSISVVDVMLPRRFDTIGIIDGQHRVFAYHEGDPAEQHEKQIAAMRVRQHLLVTGIVYPPAMKEPAKRKFEAKLFLEINDKQKRVKGDLKQSIERIVDPFSAVAIAKAVVEGMAAKGPLQGQLHVHQFDDGRIKTTSIVSYALRHLVDVSPKTEVGFFRDWSGDGKRNVRDGTDLDALERYTSFCVGQLNLMFAGFKAGLPDGMWTTDLRRSRALTITTINGLMFCMRALLENQKRGADFGYYQTKFKKMKVDFSPAKFKFRSSHWRDLGRLLYEECFE